MHPDIHLVTKIQSLDQRISELEKEITALPKHIAQIERALDSHNRRLEADKAALAANQKDRKKLEGDIQALEQKISKLRDQMLQSKTNEQYRAFQSEIAHFEGEVRKAEDRILDLMGESEPLEVNVKKAEVALKQERAQVEAEKNLARERTASDQKELAVVTAERLETAAKIPPDTLNLYERARKKWHGSGIAEVQDSRCTACQIGLRPQYFQMLRSGEKIQTCESCGRILYYNPPVSFETEMADRQVS
jgi:predicted  nucleic acid-binding Zn-ribbon protein